MKLAAPLTVAKAVVLFAGCASVAIVAAYQSARSNWLSAGSAPAPRWMRNDPFVRSMESEAWLAVPNATIQHEPDIRKNARRLLASHPLSSGPLRHLAIVEETASPQRSAQFWYLADRITRRDTSTQLELINVAAGKGSVSQTLAHYDHLLMLGAATDQLLPTLARGLGHPEIRSGLLRYDNRPWMRSLVTSALQLGGDAHSVGALAVRVSRRMPPAEAAGLSGQIASQLLARQEYGALNDLLAALPYFAPKLTGDLAITAATADPRFAPLTWSWRNDGGINASPDSHGNVDIAVAPVGSGLAAERTTLVRAGPYTLSHTVSYAEALPRARISWDVRCSDGRPIWQGRPSNTLRSMTYKVAIVVPEDCPAQTWRLSASADESQFDSLVRLSGVKLLPG